MKGRKRRDNERYELLEGGEHIPVPDYAMFRLACNEVGKELNMSGLDVYRLYKAFINCSIELLFPEGNPKELNDEELLNPRRRIQIPRVASLEVTTKSLYSWRKIEQRIKNKRKDKNNA